MEFLLFDHFRQFCKIAATWQSQRKREQTHRELSRVSLWKSPGFYQRPHGSYSAMGKWVKRENFGAGPVSPSSGKVQTVLFPSWGEQSIWEGASSPRWDFAFNGISLSLNGILLWFLPSSNKQKAHRFTLGLCSHVQTAWGPSWLFKKPPWQRGTAAPVCMYGSVCIYTHVHYAE